MGVSPSGRAGGRWVGRAIVSHGSDTAATRTRQLPVRRLVLVQAVVVGAGLAVAPAHVGVVGAPRRDDRLVRGLDGRGPAVARSTGRRRRRVAGPCRHLSSRLRRLSSRGAPGSLVTGHLDVECVDLERRVRRDEVGVVAADRARVPDGSSRAACGCTRRRLGRRHPPMIPPGAVRDRLRRRAASRPTVGGVFGSTGGPAAMDLAGVAQRIPRVIALRTAVSIR